MATETPGPLTSTQQTIRAPRLIVMSGKPAPGEWTSVSTL